ncbi:hypothetical protein EYF80_041125 [Liparis tanakae]|uniref:Uncharacterized protein n=1 Tax=Liparis tanakae TaxID=230148 RepID=A0A4Z2G543_9TELE|nr:hypothetical protein EYF80_041125 [Liparis tanakae]
MASPPTGMQASLVLHLMTVYREEQETARLRRTLLWDNFITKQPGESREVETEEEEEEEGEEEEGGGGEMGEISMF